MDAHDDLDEGETRELRGIGGWLLLFTLGRLLAVPLLGFALFVDVFSLVKPGVWQALTTPGSTAYDPLWSSTLIYETTGNALWLFCSVVIVFLLFSQRKILRPLMVTYMVGLVLFYWGGYLLASHIARFSAAVLGRMLGTGVIATINALIWVPYWLVSERVKGTFYK